MAQKLSHGIQEVFEKFKKKRKQINFVQEEVKIEKKMTVASISKF